MTDLEVSLFFQSQKFQSLPRLFKIFKLFMVFCVLDKDGVKVKTALSTFPVTVTWQLAACKQ